MGYNIADVSGNSAGGPAEWTFTLDLSDPSVSTVSGDFNVVSVLGGEDLGEATDGYSFSALDTEAYGSLSGDTADGTFTFTVDRAAVFASGSDQVVSFTIIGTSGADSDDDLVQVEILICVARGTLIRTATGQVPVEEISAGDMVLTKDGGPRPVRWVGSRRLSPAELSADPSLRPIRIAASALGDDLPSRELTVSPQHRVLVSDWRAELLFGDAEVLVPAKALVNDHSIRMDTSLEPTEYFHLMFDDHEVIFTEGAATESFHAGQYSLRELGDAARVELHKLFPELFEPDCRRQTARLSLRPWEGRLVCDAAHLAGTGSGSMT
jgi:hypothetical protein